MLPFLAVGVDDGQPTMVALGDRTADLIRSALPSGSPVGFPPGSEVNARPAATINHAYEPFPAWAICTYDRRLAPASVLDDVTRTHPQLAGYTDPIAFLGEEVPLAPDPVQHGRPVAELIDPMPAAARRAVRDAGHAGVTEDQVEDLMLAVNEVVTNAMLHGRPPVEVRIWTGADRIVVAVTDHGHGPADPFAGLLPPAGTDTSGRGLWITYQSVAHVATVRTGGTFTIRLTAGNPH